MIELSVNEVSEHPDYQILKRINAVLPHRVATNPKQFIATIIDLETMGFMRHYMKLWKLGC